VFHITHATSHATSHVTVAAADCYDAAVVLTARAHTGAQAQLRFLDLGTADETGGAGEKSMG
jgi:hypothetical protein